ncbi:hypothetical protein H5T87_04725 [bacterium]|nr:hypothetical protein [bacterium]
MKKELSPITLIIVIVVILAIIAFVYIKFTSKQVKKPPPGVMPVPKAPPSMITPLIFHLPLVLEIPSS